MTQLRVVSLNVTLVVHECPSCMILHAIPQDMHDRRLAMGGTVCCPAGHKWEFTTTQVERLEQKLRASREAERSAHDYAREEHAARQAAERSAAAYRGHATRLRNLAKAGRCPAGCDEKFADLAAHMAGEHPDFTAEQAEETT